MHQARPGTRDSGTPGRVGLSDGSITIRDEAAFGPEGGEACARFLSKVLAIADVRSVRVDRQDRSASIRHGADPGRLPDLLGRLANALRISPATSSPIPLPSLPSSLRFSLHRHGSTLTTWEILSDEPGLLRLRQECLRNDAVAVDRIKRELLGLPGVRAVKAHERSGFFLIRYDPSAIASRALLGRAESTLLELEHGSSRTSRSIVSGFGAANLSLGIAAVGEFLVPALLPVSAVLLVVTNARTVRSAFRQLGMKRLGLPVLYTAIVVTTLATGQFLASALMTWLFRFWDRRFKVDLASERHRLLERTSAGPLMARLLVPSGVEVLVPDARLRPGDQILLAKGERVPADGMILAGEGIVDERAIRGLEGIAIKKPGDPILACSTVLSGSFQVEVSRLGEATRAASIRRVLTAATSPTPGQSAPTARSEMFASRAVGPTLATASVGFLAGDLMTVGAILRPDYATGPGLAVPLETLHKVALCSRAGIVARDPMALERLAEVELFVLQDHPSLRKAQLEVTGIETRLPEPLLLRYAASAFRHIYDDRSFALVRACRERRIHVLNLEAIEFGRGVTVLHDRHRVRVGDVQSPAGSIGSLGVEIDGNVVGLIEFGQGSSLEAASAIDRVRRDSHVPFALVSPGGTTEVSSLAKSLSVEMFRGDFTPENTSDFLAACRARGLKAAFVGDCRLHPRAASQAHVAISLADERDLDVDLDSDPAAFLIQQGRLDPLVDLIRLSRIHATRVNQAQKLILVPNLLCIAGAFLFGFTGMTAVMLSNLGTLGLYRLASDSLRSIDPPRKGPSGPARRAG